MTEKKERSLRRTVILTLLAATIVFALLLCAGVYAGRRLPEWPVKASCCTDLRARENPRPSPP